MTRRIFAIIASISAGILLAIVIQFNASLGMRVGVLESTFLAHFIGTVLALVLIFWNINRALIRKVSSSSKYLFVGGVLGVLTTIVCNFVVPVLGMVVTISLLVIADLIFCTVADHIGFFGLPRFLLTRQRLVGLFLAIAGLMLVFWS